MIKLLKIVEMLKNKKTIQVENKPVSETRLLIFFSKCVCFNRLSKSRTRNKCKWGLTRFS